MAGERGAMRVWLSRKTGAQLVVAAAALARAITPTASKRFILGACALASMSILVSGASAVPAPFQLVFDGKHVVATFPTPTGLAHEGPFTTDSPLCPSGYARDIAQTDQVATRVFGCDGSGGTFTATISPHVAEHGGGGSWQIIAGSGPLTDLRGRGSFTSVLTGGDPNDFQTVTFRSTWQGVVDLDASPPSLAVTRAIVRKLARPAGTYSLRLGISLSDGNSNPVTYTLVILDPKNLSTLARKSGQMTSGALALALKIRPSKTTRSVHLDFQGSDPLGNQSDLERTIRVR